MSAPYLHEPTTGRAIHRTTLRRNAMGCTRPRAVGLPRRLPARPHRGVAAARVVDEPMPVLAVRGRGGRGAAVAELVVAPARVRVLLLRADRRRRARATPAVVPAGRLRSWVLRAVRHGLPDDLVPRLARLPGRRLRGARGARGAPVRAILTTWISVNRPHT